MRPLLLTCLLSSALLGCAGGPKPNPNLVNASKGGTVSSQNGILEIPGGALTSNTEIMVKDLADSASGTPPSGVKKVLLTTQSIMVGGIDANSITPVENTIALKKPLVWKSKWTPAALSSIQGNPEDLALFRVLNGEWIRLDKVQIDVNNRWCKFEFVGQLGKQVTLVLGVVDSDD